MESKETICVVCQQGSTEFEPLVCPCHRCSVCFHERCLELSIRMTASKIKDSKRIDPYNWLLWLFNRKVYEEQITPPVAVYPGPIAIHYRQSLTCGFIDAKIKCTPSISDLLILTNMKPNDTFSMVCPNCRADIQVIGRKSMLSGVHKVIGRLKSFTLATVSVGVVCGFALFSLFSMAATFAFSLDWASDFFRQTEDLEYTELLRFVMVPHFVYTMVTPNVGMLQLISASIYSSFSYGIPVSGITTTLQKFIYGKLITTLTYRLTINRYYYESFKQTIPAVFGLKLSIDDAWAIQDYRNEAVPEAYNALPFWSKCKLWMRDTWYCLWEDFGELYRVSGWDVFFGNFGFLSTFAVGLLLGEGPVAHYSFNIYLTESQNQALSKFVGIAITQMVYFCISTLNSCALASCYKSLKPGEGYMPDTKVRRAAEIVFATFSTHPTVML